MKKILVFIPAVFFVLLASGQKGFAFDVGMGTSKSPMLAAKYYFDKNAASIGGSYQIFNNALGEKTNGRIPGTKGIGEGDYFYSIDIGYTRVVTEHFSVSAELSFGKRYYYYNASDSSASAGAYHYIHKTKSELGGGALLFYNLNETFGFFAGYNSLREGTLGLEIRFLKEKQY